MNKLINEILKDYEKIRDQSLKESLLRRKEIYEKIPEIDDIDKKIKDIGIKISQSIFLKPEKSQKLLYKLKSDLAKLRSEKTNLLVSHGYPETYLDQKYQCNICKDTGFVNNKKCRCFKQKLIDKYYKQSSIKDITKTENFGNFNLDYYSDISQDSKPSPKKNMKGILDSALNFINNFSNEKESLFFYGNSGLGKTFLSNCIAKELLDMGKIVLYRTSPELIEGLRMNKLSTESDTYSEYMDLLKSSDLLIIDDLGTEPITAFSLQEIFNIINERLLLKKKFIISTNLQLSEIVSTYPERICSRIFGNFKMLYFYGEDIRLKRKILI